MDGGLAGAALSANAVAIMVIHRNPATTFLVFARI